MYNPFSILTIIGLLLGMLSLPQTAICAEVQVSATIIASKGKCSIISVTPAIFLPLNPLIASDETADATIKVNCTGLGNKTINVIVQRQDSSPLYLLNTDNLTDTIFYSLLNFPRSEAITNNSPLDITVTAAIEGGAYQDAPAGPYSGTVAVDVLP